MYTPRHWHWVMPVSSVLAGFWVRNKFGASWDVTLLVQVPLDFIACAWSVYLWKAGVIWQNFEAEWNAPGDRKPKAQPAAVPYNNYGRQTLIQLPQVTSMPKLNNEQKFYKALIDMRNGGLEVTLKESYWISPVNRYGESRDAFVAMKDDGVRCGALCRAGERKNAPHVVADWRKVRLMAGGYSPPRPPQ
jgi:hypothetical protein